MLGAPTGGCRAGWGAGRFGLPLWAARRCWGGPLRWAPALPRGTSFLPQHLGGARQPPSRPAIPPPDPCAVAAPPRRRRRRAPWRPSAALRRSARTSWQTTLSRRLARSARSWRPRQRALRTRGTRPGERPGLTCGAQSRAPPLQPAGACMPAGQPRRAAGRSPLPVLPLGQPGGTSAAAGAAPGQPNPKPSRRCSRRVCGAAAARQPAAACSTDTQQAVLQQGIAAACRIQLAPAANGALAVPLARPPHPARPPLSSHPPTPPPAGWMPPLALRRTRWWCPLSSRSALWAWPTPMTTRWCAEGVLTAGPPAVGGCCGWRGLASSMLVCMCVQMQFLLQHHSCTLR